MINRASFIVGELTTLYTLVDVRLVPRIGEHVRHAFQLYKVVDVVWTTTTFEDVRHVAVNIMLYPERLTGSSKGDRNSEWRECVRYLMEMPFRFQDIVAHRLGADPDTWKITAPHDFERNIIQYASQHNLVKDLIIITTETHTTWLHTLKADHITTG